MAARRFYAERVRRQGTGIVNYASLSIVSCALTAEAGSVLLNFGRHLVEVLVRLTLSTAWSGRATVVGRTHVTKQILGDAVTVRGYVRRRRLNLYTGAAVLLEKAAVRP